MPFSARRADALLLLSFFRLAAFLLIDGRKSGLRSARLPGGKKFGI